MRIIVIVAILFGLQLKAQEFDDFEILRSSGSVPEEFNMLSSEKVKAEIKELTKNQKRADKKSEKRFILESNYFIDQLLSNGAILYNEDLSHYVSNVADELLVNDKELRGQVRFYIVKSASVNAFATDRGTIFITIGLLAKINTEAQLAYVLAHEIIHFKNKHARTGFVENERIEQGRGEYKRVTWEKALSKSKYSKELELEADREGLQIFLSSKYSIDEVGAVFDVLEHSHLPIDNLPLDPNFLNDEYLNVTKNYTKEKIDSITSIKEEDDAYQTHPNISKRRAIMDFELEDKSNDGRSDFLYSETEFNKINRLAQFELSFLFTKNRLYGEAIYNSYVLLKSFPGNKFLRTNIAYCLYAISKYKNEGKEYDVLTNYENVQGQSQQIFYMFKKMDKKLIGTLAVKYLWGLKIEYNEDSFITSIAMDAMKELLFESGVKQSYFKKEKVTLSINSDELEKLDSTKLSKNDQVVSEKEERGEIAYAFVELFKEKEFVSAMSKYEMLFVNKLKDEGDVEDESNRAKYKKEKIGRALGIDKVVMVSPNYRHFDLRKKVNERYEFSESRKEDFIGLNKKCAKIRGVDLQLISNTYFNSTDQYNDMSCLNDWMDERWGHENVKIYPYCKMYTDDLIEKYGTSYFGWTGMYSMRAKKEGMGFTIYGSIVYSVMTYGLAVPYIVYNLTKPENHTFYYTYLTDISNYDFLMSKEDYVKVKDHNDLIKSYMYDTYNQIKSKKKTK
jgi:hypothetical protein